MPSMKHWKKQVEQANEKFAEELERELRTNRSSSPEQQELADRKAAHRRSLGPVENWHPPRVYLLTDDTAIRAQYVFRNSGWSDTDRHRYINGWTMRRSPVNSQWVRHERVGAVELDTGRALASWESGPYPGDEKPKQRCQCSWCTP